MTALSPGRGTLIMCLLWAVTAMTTAADEHRFPVDFDQPVQVIGGAGGGTTRQSESLARLPVIMIADNGRIHHDWLGANCGLAPGSVYQAFLDHGFSPGELWMLELVGAEGEHLTSLELRTDNLKEMIFAVLRYTGADQVVLLAHGAGAVVAHAALIKYNLFYAVHAAAYVAAPFHGTYACSFELCHDGLPMCCALTPGADFLNDLLVPDETPFDSRSAGTDGLWTTRYLTVRNGLRFGDRWFERNPESPELLGATNLSFAGLDHDGLRCSHQVLASVIPFLTVAASPYDRTHDRDGDGFHGASRGGPDCNDEDPAIHPGAGEVCDDGVDQDCNAVDISCSSGKDRDLPPERLAQDLVPK